MSREGNNQKGNIRKLHKHRKLKGWAENEMEEIERLRKELIKSDKYAINKDDK